MNKRESSLFLAVACLASAACEVHLGDPNPQQPGAQPTAVAPGAPPPAANPTQATAPAPPPRLIPLHLHSDAPPPSSGAVAPAPPPPPSCLDNGAAVVGDCNAMQPPDPSCGASTASAKQRCSSYKAYFTSKVAAAAVTCMTALSSRQVCDAVQTDNCAKSALAQACADSSIAQLCSIAAAPCKTNASDCSSLVSGLNDPGKQRVAQCVAQGCAAGLYACIF
jgi:hypothetical protein